ncbi:MAG: VWA domain-containing protein [Deltaproteobacteria bacterium]|nr:VWA domain-containing protein [Deltaproteobacteria bacterium]
MFVGLALSSGGCVRYYAGVGHGATWPGSGPTSQGYAQASTPVTQASSSATPPVVVVNSWSPGAGWSTPPIVEASASATATASVGSSGAGEPSAGGSIEVVASLGGLCGPGAPIEGGIARLGDLSSLGAHALETTPPLYADAHVRVRASLAHDALPASGGASSVVVSVEGLAPPAIVPPLRVHLVIDASTSMEGAWDDVKTAALAVVRRLRPQDELQIVVYGTGATEALAPLAIGDGSRARAVIAGLRFGGRTHIESGLRLAYGSCRDAGRSLVIVISDGVPQGGLSSPDELGALAAQANADDGAVTLAIGLGTEFHTGILAAIGEQGGGELRLAPRSGELATLLERELAARGAIVASSLAGSVTPTPGVVIAGEARFGAGAIH